MVTIFGCPRDMDGEYQSLDCFKYVNDISLIGACVTQFI